MMEQMKQLCQDADQDHSGTISKDEFLAQINTPEMDVFLKGIELDKAEALDLFRLLDKSADGEVTPTDFVNGCMRVQGNAKAIDLAVLMDANSHALHQLRDHA